MFFIQDLLAQHFQHHHVLGVVALAEIGNDRSYNRISLVGNKYASLIGKFISANRPFFYPFLWFWVNCKITYLVSTLIAVKNWCLNSGSSSEFKLLILEMKRKKVGIFTVVLVYQSARILTSLLSFSVMTENHATTSSF